MEDPRNLGPLPLSAVAPIAENESFESVTTNAGEQGVDKWTQRSRKTRLSVKDQSYFIQNLGCLT